MKIVSWNVNSLNVRLPHVQRWCEEHRPDVLSLQETKLADEKFPHEALRELGFECAFSGQKSYNGVAILAREPMRDLVKDVDGLDDPAGAFWLRQSARASVRCGSSISMS